MEKNTFYTHKNFGELSKEELDLYLEFLADTLHKLSGFDVWEAENVHDESDAKKWEEKALSLFTEIHDSKYHLEDSIYGNF